MSSFLLAKDELVPNNTIVQFNIIVLLQFSHKYSQKTPHNSPARARYGVSFVIQDLIDILPQFLQLFM